MASKRKDHPTDEHNLSSVLKTTKTTVKSLDADDETSEKKTQSFVKKQNDPDIDDGDTRVFVMLFNETDNHSIQITRKAAQLSTYIKELVDGKMSKEYTYKRDPENPSEFLKDEHGSKIIERVTTEVKYVFTDGTVGLECETKTPLYSFVDVRMPEVITKPQLERIVKYLMHHSVNASMDTSVHLTSNDLSKCIFNPFDLKWIQEISENLGQAGFYEFAQSILSVDIKPIEELFRKQMACWIYG